MTFLYDLFFFIFALVYFPSLILRGKWHRGFRMRMGNFSPEMKAGLAGKPNIWVHAVSVGEVLAISGLLSKIIGKFPSCRVVLSVVTKTGYRVALSKFGNSVMIIYAPLDFSFVVRKYLALINPVIYIAAETEIWPNILLSLRKRNIPVVQINGRISDKSFPRYKKIRFLFRDIFRGIDMFCMQSPRDAQRVQDLGAMSANVCVTGSIKFDEVPQAGGMTLEDIGLDPQQRLWIAGSTHAGEESIVLNIYKKLRDEFQDLRLLIAARHVERIRDIEKMIKDANFDTIRLSRIEGRINSPATVIVVDTLGQLRSLYSAAFFVFMGKSLTARGGQNVIEPAAFAKPVITGPFTENFADVVRVFREEDAILEVSDEDQLLGEARRLLRDPDEARRIGQRARAVVEKYQGASEKTLEIIFRFIKK